MILTLIFLYVKFVIGGKKKAENKLLRSEWILDLNWQMVIWYIDIIFIWQFVRQMAMKLIENLELIAVDLNERWCFEG